jgi:hypothetical protein
VSEIPVGLCQCGCGGRPATGKQFLSRHNLRSPLSEAERFLSYVYPDPNSGCHIWAGADSHGYGSFTIGSLTNGTRRRIGAHLYAWLLAGNERPPDGFELCHKCHTRCCVNPDHIYVGTRMENVDDSIRDLRRKEGRLPRNVTEQVRNPGTYMVRMRYKGQRIHVGTFPSLAEAARVADQKRRELRGAPRGR